MTRIAGVSTYRPCFEGTGKGRAMGPDEDVITMAVAAGRALGLVSRPERVVIVSRQIDSVPPSAIPVIAAALDTESTPVELRLGGAASALDALALSPDGTLVIAVETESSPSAAAGLLAKGKGIDQAGHARHGIAIAESGGIHDDARLLRERAWRPAVQELAQGANGPIAIAGIPAKGTRGLVDGEAVDTGDAAGAPSAIEALIALAEAGKPGRVIAIDGGAATAIDLSDLDFEVKRQQREAAVPMPAAPSPGADIPISLSAYERAFESKVGLKAARCVCGEMSLPPRSHCLNCGRENETKLEPVAHSGDVYSVVTIHAPLPGRSVPFSVAVVDIDETPLRLLAPVTDVVPGSTAIGAHGKFVLRRMAERQGIPDYGYSFQPDEINETGDIASSDAMEAPISEVAS